MRDQRLESSLGSGGLGLAALTDRDTRRASQPPPDLQGRQPHGRRVCDRHGRDGRLVPDLTRDVLDRRQRQAAGPDAVRQHDSADHRRRPARSQRQHARQLQLVEKAAEQFVARCPDDKARIGSFSNRIQIDPRDFTSDHGQLLTILRSELQPEGPTPLWNAVTSASPRCCTSRDGASSWCSPMASTRR